MATPQPDVGPPKPVEDPPKQEYIAPNTLPDVWGKGSYRMTEDFYENSLRPALKLEAELADSVLLLEVKCGLQEQLIRHYEKRSWWERWDSYFGWTAGAATAILIMFAVR